MAATTPTVESMDVTFSPCKMNYASLYLFSDPVADGPFRGESSPHELAYPLLRGDVRCDRPIQVSWAMGAANPSDLVWTTSAAGMIVHARVIESLEEFGCTGWSAYPVQMRAKTGEILTDFFGVTIQGRCGYADDRRSEMFLASFPGGWIPCYRGRFFANDEWDGSDLFMESSRPDGHVTAFKYCSERAVSAFRAAKAHRLIELAPVPEYKRTLFANEIDNASDDLAQRIAAAYVKCGKPRPRHI